MKVINSSNVDSYIASFPKETQVLLEQMRSIIKKAAPKAEEVISYQMPAYKYNGVLVYFAGYAKHIGFYPTGRGIEAFKEEISSYKTSKGTIQFPLNKKLPVTLITKIVKYRVKENEEKAALKNNKAVTSKAANKTKQRR